MAAPITDIQAFLVEQDAKDSLRFITCGSVDDGKSTLLGQTCRSLSRFCNRIVVVAASGQKLPEVPESVHIIRDEQPYAGPLHGLISGLDYAAATWSDLSHVLLAAGMGLLSRSTTCEAHETFCLQLFMQFH